jgi:hypothetical protein
MIKKEDSLDQSKLNIQTDLDYECIYKNSVQLIQNTILVFLTPF